MTWMGRLTEITATCAICRPQPGRLVERLPVVGCSDTCWLSGWEYAELVPQTWSGEVCTSTRFAHCQVPPTSSDVVQTAGVTMRRSADRRSTVHLEFLVRRRPGYGVARHSRRGPVRRFPLSADVRSRRAGSRRRQR